MATINGTSRNDKLGNNDNVSDSVYGFAGNDILSAGGTTSDTLYGGAGNDTFNITSGTHTVADFSKTGPNGTDILNVSVGATAIVTDVLDFTGYTVANKGLIAINGTTSNDTIVGTAGVDSITGGNGNDNDNLTGNAGADTFNVTSGTDTITDLGNGSDILKVSSGATANATVTGNFTATSSTVNNGTANLTLSGATSVNLTAATGSEGFQVTTSNSASSVTGSAQDDTLHGGNGNDSLIGGNGSDDLTGGYGNDSLIGGNGSDDLTGGYGNDTLTGGDDEDTFNVDFGTDTVTDFASGDTLNVRLGATAILTNVRDASSITALQNQGTIALTGTAARDSMVGSAGQDSMVGGADNDSLWGGNGNDTLDGGTGADRFWGGEDDDTYIVDNAGDAVVEFADGFAYLGGIDSVRASISYSLTAYVEHLTLTGTAALNGTGNELDNQLTGNSAVNSLYGLAGEDTLDGGAGADKLYGGSSDDTYYIDNTGDKVIEYAGEGTEDKIFSSVSYTLSANVENLELDSNGRNTAGNGTANLNGTGNDLANDITGTDGNNALNGNDGNDSLLGYAGNDQLNGDAGADTLRGGDGNDTLKGGGDHDSLTGGAGNDLFNVESGTDTIDDFGNGTDILVVASGATADVTLLGNFTATSATKNNGGTVTLDQSADVTVINLAAVGGTAGYTVKLDETGDAAHVTGSKFADFINVTSEETAHTIEGGAGDDVIQFLSDGDLAEAQVFGDGGSDTLQMTSAVNLSDTDFKQIFGVESLQLANYTNSVTLGVYSSTAGLANVTGGTDIDTIDADESLIATNLNGGNGADIITGSDYADQISGGADADQISGGMGDDTFVISATSDFGDIITDFGDYGDDDVIQIANALTTGSGSADFGDGLSHSESTTLYDFVVFDDLATGTSDASSADDIVIAINNSLASSSYTNAKLFVLVDGDDTTGGDDGYLWHWVDTGDGTATSGELTQVAKIIGHSGPDVADIIII